MSQRSYHWSRIAPYDAKAWSSPPLTSHDTHCPFSKLIVTILCNEVQSTCTKDHTQSVSTQPSVLHANSIFAASLQRVLVKSSWLEIVFEKSRGWSHITSTHLFCLHCKYPFHFCLHLFASTSTRSYTLKVFCLNLGTFVLISQLSISSRDSAQTCTFTSANTIGQHGSSTNHL